MSDRAPRSTQPPLHPKPAPAQSLARQQKMHRQALACFHDIEFVAGRRSTGDAGEAWPLTKEDREGIHNRAYIQGRSKGYVHSDKILKKYVDEHQARVAAERALSTSRNANANQVRYIGDLRKRNSKLAGIADRREEPPASKRKSNRGQAMARQDRQDRQALTKAPSPSAQFGGLLNDIDAYCYDEGEVDATDSEGATDPVPKRKTARPKGSRPYAGRTARTVRTSLPKRRLVAGRRLPVLQRANRVTFDENVTYLSATPGEESEWEEDGSEKAPPARPKAKAQAKPKPKPKAKAKAKAKSKSKSKTKGKEEPESEYWVSDRPDHSGDDDRDSEGGSDDGSDDDCVITTAFDTKGLSLPDLG